jgi:hypothetical protein
VRNFPQNNFRKDAYMIRTLIIMTGAALALGAGATAIANHHGGGKMMGDKGAMMEAHFAEMDADKSGAVTEEEFVAFAVARAKAKFAEIAGDDASLTLDDMRAHHAAKMDARRNGAPKGDIADDAAEDEAETSE